MDTNEQLAVQLEDDDSDPEDTYLKQAAAAVALAYTGMEEGQLIRARRRHPNRLYLCRNQLMINPSAKTPIVWKARQPRSLSNDQASQNLLYMFLLLVSSSPT
ncbi:hypothetical protein BV22DRAFT_1128184 [Leucogyrophana mollusca]|uniref:Uncharacterized protein n=1 Tax=Leucogyrophana mollusca TaxID=85980 RepID=A0ACB8BMF7_9AGAM|nr:hypothetical protein BV22DRAFT_1128184 [Leucogyrophana mollusca]